MEYESIVKDVEVCNFHGKVGLTYNGENKLRNIECRISRKGSIVYGYFDSLARVVSASLRRGVSPMILAEKLREVFFFEPEDLTDKTPARTFPEFMAWILETYKDNPNGKNKK